MSRIYFHNIASTAEVWGGERALLGNYCSKALLFALGSMDCYGPEEPWIMKHIPASCYLHETSVSRGDWRGKDIETWLTVGGMTSESAGLLWDGALIPLFDLQLNSAMTLGGDAVRLAARIHGQCEIHCFVEGRNRQWLAGLIDDALAKRIFREEVGWESVVALLRAADDTPAVCSYSVCSQFPGMHIADWPTDDESWYDLPKARQWEISMKALRERADGLELTPDGWGEFFFGRQPVSGFDFSNAESKRDLTARRTPSTP